ncbi:MAG: MFS transporter [Planctomycetota bacterium]
MAFRRRSYETIPVLSVRGHELRRALRTTTAAWMFGIIWLTCIGGSRINVFGRMVGFTNEHFGWLAAIPFITKGGQLVATVLIEKTGLRKYQFLYCASIHRLTWLGVAAVPLIAMIPGVPPLPAPWAVYFVLGLLSLSFFSDALAAPAWLNWMGDMIPRRIRGRYFANRKRWTESIRMPAVIGLAIYLDWAAVPGAPMTPDAQPLLFASICVIFGIAAVLGAVDIWLFIGIREVLPSTRSGPRRPAVNIRVLSPRQAAGPAPDRAGAVGRFGHYAPAYAFWPARLVGESLRELMVHPLSDRTFRRYTTLAATATFAMTVSGPFFWRHCLEFCNFSQVATDALFMVIGPLVGILAAKYWGSLIDRWGRRPVLMLGSLLTCFSVLPYFLSGPQTPTPAFLVDATNALTQATGRLVGVDDFRPLSYDGPLGAWLIMCCSMILGGIGWGGFHLAQNNIILGYVDGPGRSKYIAGHAVLMGLGGFLGGFTGGKVAALLSEYQLDPVQVGPFLWNNWHATFALTLLARWATLLQTINLPDPGSRRVTDLVRSVRSNMYNYVRPGFLDPFRRRWLYHGRSDEDR